MEISNINVLVQSILKLSKFDSNTIEFINQKIKVSDLLDKSVKKLLPLCDLRNININVNINQESVLNCDVMWQVEALSNIIKNCIEHSEDGSNIDIYVDKNNIYTSIKIVDYGSGIDKQDLPHIFDRFYKGKDSDVNSIGIGLALAKTIIDKNNGSIMAKSDSNRTTFDVKYYI